jgi:hypothetical protein
MNRNKKSAKPDGQTSANPTNMASAVDLALKFGFDQGRKRGLVDGLRLHLAAKFGDAGRRLAGDAGCLDDFHVLQEFAELSWKMRSFEKVRACLDRAFQKEGNTTVRMS